MAAPLHAARLAVAVVMVAAVSGLQLVSGEGARVTAGRARTVPAVVPAVVPAPAQGIAATGVVPRGAAAVAVGAARPGPYGFAQTNPDGTPARWNPCRAIGYVTNLQEAPAGAGGIIDAALQQVSAATGLRFVDEGSTTELATKERPLKVRGDWNPVLIVWEEPGQSDYLSRSGEDGEGGFVAVSNSQGKWVDVTGQVALDASAADIPGFASEGGWAHLLLHEFGHVIGLAHVNDPHEVMNPVSTIGAPVAYGTGDLAGLAHLGARNGCLAEPPTSGF